ncbi:MAG: sigma-70 family RNA polymerase sigma factor [Anaerolineales bacterium]
MEPAPVNDLQLIQRISRGDQAALGLLYDRYANLVFTVASNTLQDRWNAEEVTQDVFWRVWTKAEGYDPARAQVSTWLCSIARYRAIDMLRQLSSRPERDSVAMDEVEPRFLSDPSEDLQQSTHLNLQKEKVRSAIAQLPSKQREVLVWAYFGGYTHEQIAEKLEIPLGTAKTRVRLALRRLRGLLAGD